MFGKPPDRFPHDREAVWQITGTGLIYVVADSEWAGRALVTLIVDDLEDWRDEVAERGIAPGAVQRLEGDVRRVSLSDPDGNRISVGEVPGPS